MKKINLILFALIIFSACTNEQASEPANSEEYGQSDDLLTETTDQELTTGLVNKTKEPYFANQNLKEGKKGEYERDINEKKEEVTKQTYKIPAKIRKTAYLNLTVNDYKKAHATIEKIIKLGNAYIGSEDEQNTTYSIYNTMVIRVMNKDFDAMVNSVTDIASHVNSKNIAAEDVTAQFVDIQTRLKSKKEIEQRYISILQKAAKVTDILEIEQKLGEIREEIEAKEGELKYLADQVDYSTINLKFAQNFEYTPIDRPGFWGRSGNAFERGWDGFLSFIVGLVNIWPLLLIVGVGTYFLMKFIRKQLKK